VLYGMWMKAGANHGEGGGGGFHDAQASNAQPAAISFPQFCYTLRDWTSSQLDVMLGVLTQECNESILKVREYSVLQQQQSTSQQTTNSSPFLSNPKILKNAHLCTPAWLQSLERLFLLLDTQCVAYWDLDRIMMFLEALLQQNDKRELIAAPTTKRASAHVKAPQRLLNKAKEFMDSLPIYDGVLTLKSLKVFFLENALSESTIQSTTKCLHDEIALYNGICDGGAASIMEMRPQTDSEAVLKHPLMWKQACNHVLSASSKGSSQKNGTLSPTLTTKLQNYLEYDSDAVRYQFVLNLFSEGHASALTNDFLKKVDEQQDSALYQTVYNLMVNILLLYKKVLNRVIHVSAGVEDGSMGLIRQISEPQDDELLSGRQTEVNERQQLRGPLQQQREPTTQQLDPHTQHQQEIQRAPSSHKDVSQHSQASSSATNRHPPPQHQSSSYHQEPQASENDRTHRSESQVTTERRSTRQQSSHQRRYHESQHVYQNPDPSSYPAPLSSVPSVSSGRSRPSTANRRHRDYPSRAESLSQRSKVTRDEISELSSLDDDLTIVKLPFNMEKRIRNAEWRDIKYENCEKFQYLPVRTGPVVPEWSKDHGHIHQSETGSVKQGDVMGRGASYEGESKDEHSQRYGSGRSRAISNTSHGQHSEYTVDHTRQAQQYGSETGAEPPQEHNNPPETLSRYQPEQPQSRLKSHASNLDAIERQINSTLNDAGNLDEPVPTWVPDVAKRIIAELMDKSKDGGISFQGTPHSTSTAAFTSPTPTVHIKSDDLQRMLNPSATQVQEDKVEAPRSGDNHPQPLDDTMTPQEKREPTFVPQEQPVKPEPVEPAPPTQKTSFFGRKKRPNPKKAKSFSLLKSPRKKKTTNSEATTKQDSLITGRRGDNQKEPSPERELFDHLSLDDDTQEEIQFDADITPASLKHMLALTRSGRSSMRVPSRGSGRSSAPLARSASSPLHRASNTGPQSSHSLSHRNTVSGIQDVTNQRKHQEMNTANDHLAPDGKRVVQPIALNQVPRKRDNRAGFTSGYPGLQGEEKEVQLPSLPKSYYKHLRQNRVEKSPKMQRSGSANEKRMWRI